MGEPTLKNQIVTMEDLIEAKYFDSKGEIYATPDSILPRVRRGGKIVRPLRFYWKDVEKLFSQPPPVQLVSAHESGFKPSITFKKRRK